MLNRRKEYSLIEDKKLVELLVAKPVDEGLHDYFFNEKCKGFLTYISTSIFHNNDFRIIVGELYEFLSDNDWAVLKKWESKNGASLYSYVAQCSINHFLKKSKEEKKRSEKEFVPDTPEFMEYLCNIIPEEEEEELPVWKAYEMLNDRDREVLKLIVIDGKSTLEASRVLLKYIRTEVTPEKNNNKRVQCTISMVKHRAQLTLLENLKSLMSN